MNDGCKWWPAEVASAVLALKPLINVRLLCPDCAEDKLFNVTLLPRLPIETNES